MSLSFKSLESPVVVGQEETWLPVEVELDDVDDDDDDDVGTPGRVVSVSPNKKISETTTTPINAAINTERNEF